MKLLFALSFSAFAAASCSNPMKAEESDRRNLYKAQFFNEQGFPGKAVESARKVKKSSKRYNEALELIDRIEMDQLGPAYSEEY